MSSMSSEQVSGGVWNIDDSSFTIHNLPVEIILLIFDYLSDANRWSLASASGYLLHIFNNWGYFNVLPITYVQCRNSAVRDSHASIKTSNYVLTSLPFKQQPLTTIHISDLEKTSNHSENTVCVFEDRVDLSQFENKLPPLDKDAAIFNIYPHELQTAQFPVPLNHSVQWKAVINHKLTANDPLTNYFIISEFTFSKNKRSYELIPKPSCSSLF